MLYTLISSQIFVEKRSKFFSAVPERVQKLWNKWELRLTVLLSLFFQVLLILLGSRRRRINKIWVQIILWIAYLCADWVAAVALGILSHSIDQPKANELPAFWAPFLLLHLGGPDTITAFSLEDNELWLRHLLGLGVQGSIASYITFRSWTGTRMSILTALMFVPAIVKYAERTWVLSSASKEHLRDSMLSPPDPGPSYAKFMDEYNSKEKEGFRVTMRRVEESERKLVEFKFRQPTTVVGRNNESNAAAGGGGDDDVVDEESGGGGGDVVFDEQSGGGGDDDVVDEEILIKARYFFEIFKRLFAFLILSYDDWVESKSFFQQRSYQKAFKLIEVELGFMFDVLYTKAGVFYSTTGCILRAISFSFTLSVFAVFLIFEKQHHSSTDVIITYLLLALAIILEIYAAILLIFSDSAFLWLRKHGLDGPILRWRGNRPRWSNSIGQYNLFNVWLNDKPTFLVRKVRNLLGIEKKLRNYWFTTHEDVSKELKEFIFQQLRKKSDEAKDYGEATRLCRSRGGGLLQHKHIEQHKFWWTFEVEFDQSVLIWHIATELCYQSDNSDPTPLKQREISKRLSDYMLYLLVVCPFMLPEGVGEIRSKDTEEEAKRFLKEKKGNKLKLKISEACRLLENVKTDIPPIEVKGPKCKSVLFDGCRLAIQLKSLRREETWDATWDAISLVWVDMLSYAAAQCKGPNHAQQLGQGGEFFTHVWLLMAHLGITEQFQMPTGFARKLIYR
ncbi:uncharacterized protein LOC122067131 [Macadamia integrifolia]|uniref:uncharacterized protein LOC122067131 n=1 Tax=Macadamia integrifolia TaxID=60698 RepID=UPI001C4F23D6|nr:uncharacterized protein LOC122067131 [Macadamia integrifolia]